MAIHLTILGSGGAIPTPKIGCTCAVCTQARTHGIPYARHSSALFLAEANVLFDAPEDISASINATSITQLDALFLTHWHPDHCFGLRLIMESGYQYYHETVLRRFTLYIPQSVYPVLRKVYPSLTYQLETLRTANLVLLADRECVEFDHHTVQPIGFTGANADTFGYLIRDRQGHSVLYSPCDTATFETFHEFRQLDVWITECGCFTDYPDEMSLAQTIHRVDTIRPRRTIFTHIEEEELRLAGWEALTDAQNRYGDRGVEFAYDRMEILVE